MRYGNTFGAYEIFVEAHKGEKEADVLRAIATASFEMALGDGGIQLPISDEEARLWIEASIKMSDKQGEVVVAMPQVGGRWCLTYLMRLGPNHFALSNGYQQYRGVPDPMLERARQILKTKN